MPNRDLIVVGASAGGIEALREILSQLPADLPATVMLVVHMAPTGGLPLARVLDRMTDLEVRLAEDGDPLVPGRLYVAPGDRHLLVGAGHLHVRRGPRESGLRPAADPLFRSAAAYYGPRTLGVVLSGTLSDGTAGLYTIKARGGIAVVQSPEDALYSGMPTSAVEHVAVDHVADVVDLGPLINRLAREEVHDTGGPLDPHLQLEVQLMETDDRAVAAAHPGQPAPWPCPDCNGVLWEIQDGSIVRYRCRVGHAWTSDSLLSEQARGVESALWMALRALEDRAALSRKLAERAEAAGRRFGAIRHREDLEAMDSSVETIRRMLAQDNAGFEVHDEPDDRQGTL